MSEIKIKPMTDVWGCIEWVFYRNFSEPILILSDSEMKNLVKTFNEVRAEIIKARKLEDV